MFLILLFLFTAIPAIEIYLFIHVGGQIGALNTFGIVLLTGVLGASLARAQGMEILGRLQGQINNGQLPASEIIQGVLIFAGGLLLLTPGFLTDAIGMSFIFPLTRMIWAKCLQGYFTKAIQNGHIHVARNFGRSTPFSTPFDGPPRRPDSSGRSTATAPPRSIPRDSNVIDVDFERR